MPDSSLDPAMVITPLDLSSKAPAVSPPPAKAGWTGMQVLMVAAAALGIGWWLRRKEGQ